MSKWKGVNKARARRRKGTRTKAERERARCLDAKRLAQEILHWEWEPMKLRLGKGSWYAPDFLVVELDYTIVLEEVKGQRGWKLDDEGRTKWKVAGRLFPYFTLRGVMRNSAGLWVPEDYDPTEPFPLSPDAISAATASRSTP